MNPAPHPIPLPNLLTRLMADARMAMTDDPAERPSLCGFWHCTCACWQLPADTPQQVTCLTPHVLADPAKRGARYWHFTVNELGIQDMEAQVERIHCVKSAELGSRGKGLVHGPLASGFLPAPFMNAATLEAALGCACSLTP